MYLFRKYISKPLVQYGQSIIYESRRSIYFASEMFKERKGTMKEDGENNRTRKSMPIRGLYGEIISGFLLTLYSEQNT